MSDSAAATNVVGVLALQGGFAAHERALAGLGATTRQVRVPSDLNGVAALVLPGGESTTMMLGIEREGLAAPIAEFTRSGRPVLATCAGTILLSDSHLGLLDVTCDRNAYGGQIHSFESPLQFGGDPFPGIFIRAPRITRAGPGVETLASVDGDPVAVRLENIFALTFHPELSRDDRMHSMFLESFAAGGVTGNVSDINTKRRAA